MYFVLDGELALSGADSATVSVTAGDTVGLIETLAGVPLGRSAQVARPGWALKVTHEDLFDLLGQQPDLLRHLFGALLGARQEAAHEMSR
jgi:CRP-like cAMP-binding protein